VACAEVEDCAWCASENQCMTVSDVFGHDCRGTVFDPPCPTSFAGGRYGQITLLRQEGKNRLTEYGLFWGPTPWATYYNTTDSRVTGNLIVEPDPTFGGGAITAGGKAKKHPDPSPFGDWLFNSVISASVVRPLGERREL